MTRIDNVDPMTQAIQRADHLKEETCIGYSKTLTLFDRSSKEQRTSTKLNLAFPKTVLHIIFKIYTEVGTQTTIFAAVLAERC